MNKYLKKENLGFTSFEIVVVLVIVAVLVSLSALGASTITRNNRNTNRASLLSEFKLGLEQYFLQNGKYPNVDEIYYSNSQGYYRICFNKNGANCGNDFYQIKASELYLQPNSISSDSNGTIICYLPQPNNTYKLGILEEGGDWEDLSLGVNSCSSTDTIDSQNSDGFLST